MPKLRVYQLARELNRDNSEIIRELQHMGVPVTSHSNTVEDRLAEQLRRKLGVFVPEAEAVVAEATKQAPVEAIEVAPAETVVEAPALQAPPPPKVEAPRIEAKAEPKVEEKVEVKVEAKVEPKAEEKPAPVE